MDPGYGHEFDCEDEAKAETGVKVEIEAVKIKRGRKKKEAANTPVGRGVPRCVVVNHGVQSLGYSGRLKYGPDFWKGILQ